MSSPVCTHCTEVLQKLLREGKDLKYPEVVAYPQRCHLCANLYKGEPQTLSTRTTLSDFHYFIQDGLSPGSYHLTVQYVSTTTNMQETFKLGSIQTFFIETKTGTFNATSPKISLILITLQANHFRPTICDSESDIISQSSLAFMLSKYEQCVTSHSRCSKPGIVQRSFVPTRLLEVQGQDPSRVKLVDIKSDTTLPYCTLSHCWGGAALWKLTRHSECTIRTGVLVEQLPKTFRDAVEVCRQLKVPYLWIDSLCIFQDTDDLTDWHVQSASMGDIYSFARFNISATSAADSSIGLWFKNQNALASVPFTVIALNERQPSDAWNEERQETVFMISPNKQFHDEVEYSPLNRRAWVVQERLLSPTVLHFSSIGVFWECLTDLCCEIHPDRLPERDEVFAKDDLRLKKLLLTYKDGDLLNTQCAWNDEIYGSWSDLLSYYSACDLSFATDRLVAINGIAERVAQVTGDSFVCGLWKQHLVPQLLWHSGAIREKHQSSAWVAPTWSWASHGNHIEHSFHFPSPKGRELAIVQKISMDKRSSGQIIQAALVLSGRVVHGSLGVRRDHHWNHAAFLLCTLSGASRDDVCHVIMDDDQGYPTHRSVVCMAIYEDNCPRAPAYGDLGVLIFEECVSKPETYRRIGVMLLKGEQKEFYKSNESATEQSIELV